MTSLIIGQVVSGTWWNKGFDNKGYAVPMRAKRFENGVVIGFTKVGGPIIEVKRGNLTFKVYRTQIDGEKKC